MIRGKIISMALCLIVSIFALPMTMFAQTGISAEEHILNELRRAGIPNAAVAVIQGEETSFILKDSELDTLFELASVTKPITAFGVLLLEDMGLLSVNDPVNLHLPWFEVRYNGVLVPHEDITIYDLIHHTSGIAQNENRFPRAELTETTDEFIARLIGMELDFYPSTSGAYSNMAYAILGLLIEAVSGQSYDDFMTQQVLHPLGLYNTFTNPQQARDTGRNVSGHVFGFLQARPGTRGVYRNIIDVPPGGIYSCVSDMARWAGIQLGLVDVPEQFARIVQRSHTLRNDSDIFVDDGGFFRGYFFAGGWVQNVETGHLEHAGGGTAGWTTKIRIFPESNTAVVVLANLRLGISTDNLARMSLDAVVNGTFISLGQDWQRWVDRWFTLITVLGVVYFCQFVWKAIKLRKQLQGGAMIKSNFSSKSLKGLSGVIFSIACLVFYYIFPYVLLDTTRASLLNNWVTSFGVAAIAIWINVLHDVFSWWIKEFVKLPDAT